MDKRELEKKLKELGIPAASEERKKETVRAAMKEYARHREEEGEKIKGSADEVRLTGVRRKRRHLKGGPVMTRANFVTATLVACILALTVVYLMNLGGVHYYAGGGTFSGSEQTVERTQVARVAPEETGLKAERYAPEDRGRMAADEFGVEEKRVASAKKGLASKEGLRESGDTILYDGDGSTGAPEADKKQVARAEDAESVLGVVALNEPVAPASMPKAEGRSGLAKSAPAVTRAQTKEDSLSRGYIATEREVSVTAQQEYAGRDRFARSEPNPVKLVVDEPVSTFSIDVDTASYAFVRRALNEGHLPQKNAVRVEELINYFNYDYKAPESRTRPFNSIVAVYPTPWNPETRLLHIGIKGHDITREKRPRANLVFLIDVSGSMSSADKLPLLKNSLKMLVNELEPDDTIAIAVYAGAAGTVLEPTSIRDKGRILATLDRLRSGGSTAGGAGIKLAYSLAEANFDPEAVNRVILATDGDFNVGISNTEELKGFVERKRKTGVYLSVLGFGQGNYNDELMQKLAQNGNGNAAYIDTLSEARKVLVEEAGSTLFTIARDVKIQVEFNPERVAEYRLIGYESRMLRREDFRNDRVDAGDIGAGHSVTAIYEITPVGSPSRLIEPLRYEKAAPVTAGKGKNAEYAFLKIRYKLPDEEKSRLITRSIGKEAEFDSLEKVPADVRFAAAVAAFGQILRGDPYTKGFGYGDVIKLAEPARGRDRFGYRSEFLNLLRLAETASDMGDR